MRPEINRTKYDSYRIPYIEEFVSGFEYESMSFSITPKSKIPIIGLCNALVGNTILKARILDMNVSKETVHIKFLEKGHSTSYMKVMGFNYNPDTNEDKSFPISCLYDYKGFEEPYIFFKTTQKFFQKRNYIVGTGDIKKGLKKGNIIAKGQNLIRKKPNLPWEHEWLSIGLPNGKIHTKILIPAKTKYKLPYRFAFKWDYPISLEYYHINYPGNLHKRSFKTETDLLFFIEQNNNVISKLSKTTELSGYARHIIIERSGEQLKEYIQNQKIKQAMSIKQLRNKLIKGYILCFMFKGLKIEIFPQINCTLSSYDFSKSICINGKHLNSLNTDSDEYKTWMTNDEGSLFKKELYKLITPSINAQFSEDTDRILSQSLYNIRTPEIGETRFYIATMKDKKTNLDYYTKILREFSQERAKLNAMRSTDTHEDALWEVKIHGT